MDVPTAVGLGLLASFVQSLGLTIQRRSHLHNERLPESEQRSEWHRPLWVVGFVVFLAANISGTIFQIGTLPIVILAPLGAVSLLYNALLARALLDDFLSQHMLLGSSLIAVGAVLIGYFGAVDEEPHSLHELLDLYTRPPFVAFAMLYLLVFVSILTMAHLTEWQLLWQPNLQQQRGRMRRRWRSLARRRRSTPALATVAEVSENSSGIATPNPAPALSTERTKLLIDSLADDLDAGKSIHGTLANASHTGPSGERRPSYGTIPHRRTPLKRANSTPAAPVRDVEADAQKPAIPSVFSLPENRPTVLALAVAYSATSGTLSGVCLLLAKSGVDLLVLTVRGNNQLSSPLSWVLISILLAAALLQLWYLNKSLKLADPVLVCPLAFCFYNISSITLGLTYFNELEQLSWMDVACICLGTALLLWGVWIISLHRSPYKDDEVGEEEDTTLWGPGWHDPAAWHEHDALVEGAAVTPLAGPLYSGALEAERAMYDS
ncbi:hypothetical protein MBRA1_001975 [Malassezia brasiliensis]|uniref:Uncharacterized protein n=1 Tax=Malassezia brasiliensis TaxID=1821822 RepID=A0AAF0ISV1_9BASI|nr:hypothetical protein MBRA1_001975 [Malassezia brasiliensis]